MDASVEPFVVRGRVALVTGGNRGIGAGVVRTLAAAGANVLINERRPGSADALARSIESDGGTCAVVCADVESPAAADMLVNAAHAIEAAGKKPGEFLFSGRTDHNRSMTTQLQLQNNRPALIEADQVERVLADIDADRGDG